MTTNYYECDKGWHHLIEETIAKIKEIDPDIQFTQIKEKFGGLRIYVGRASEETYDVIAEAEQKSYKTCEVCGQPGELDTKSGWWKTVCSEHKRE